MFIIKKLFNTDQSVEFVIFSEREQFKFRRSYISFNNEQEAEKVCDRMNADLEEANRLEQEKKKVENFLIYDADLSVRCQNVLASHNIKTLGQLAKLSEGDILRMGNLGRISLNQLRELLKDHGLKFSSWSNAIWRMTIK